MEPSSTVNSSAEGRGSPVTQGTAAPSCAPLLICWSPVAALHPCSFLSGLQKPPLAAPSLCLTTQKQAFLSPADVLPQDNAEDLLKFSRALLGQKPPPTKQPTATPKVPTRWQKSRTTHLPTPWTSTSPSSVESPDEQSLRNSIWHLIDSALSLDSSLDTKDSSWNFTSSGPERTSEQESPPRGR